MRFLDVPPATEEPSAQAQTASTTTEPSRSELSADRPLRKLQTQLPEILSATGYNKVWGVRLSPNTTISFTTMLVLQKCLRANANDIDKAVKQLKDTLIWCKEFQPLKATEEEVSEEVFDEDRFGGLGYITVIDRAAKTGKDVMTWNICGAVMDPKKMFGDLDDAVFMWPSASC